MKTTRPLIISAAAVAGLVLVATAYTPARAGGSRGVNGPDVTASRVGVDGDNPHDFAYLGTINNYRSYSMASTSCNALWEGYPAPDTPADWNDEANPPGNPVIGQALYRMNQSMTRFEQIGLSWVKHSFCAVNETSCGSCQGTICDTLGIGCADTYWASLNASTFYCGPRWEINPQGVGRGQHHGASHAGPGTSYNAGMWVHNSDIISGSRYFAEIQYVCHDEALPRRWNNASWREVFLTTGSTVMTGEVIGSGGAGGQNATRRGYSALHAWRHYNPNVQISYVDDDPGAGRFEVGTLVTDNGDGTWTYEYAVRNHNSHRAARSFEVPTPPGVTVNNTQFHDVHYHNNDGWNGLANFDGADWPVTVGANSVSWGTADFVTNPNANALRWQTLYNFRFTANTPPVPGNAVITMYRVGRQATTNVPTLVPDGIPNPACPADLTGPGGNPDGVVDVNDLILLLAGFGTNGPGADLAPPTNVVNVRDLFLLLAAFGACE